MRIYLEFEVRRVACRRCGTVKRERLDWLADNPRYTKRFAFYVGRRCRVLDDQGRRRGARTSTGTRSRSSTSSTCASSCGGPERRGRRSSASTRSRSARGTPTASWSATWSAGGRSGSAAQDRSEASMDEFFAWLGPKKSRGNSPGGDGHVEAVSQLDLSATRRRPSILFDKFHVLRHLGEALDTVRKSEYARLSGKDRRFIKGQKYTLLSHRENLTLEGPQEPEAAARRQQAAATPPTCSRSPSGSCGTTSARAGRGASSRTGAPRSSGSGSSPSRSSPR